MKLFTKLANSLRQMEWDTNFRQMWLPMLLSVGMGVTLCLLECLTYGHAMLRPYKALSFFFAAGFVFTTIVQLAGFKHNIIINISGLAILATDCCLRIVMNNYGIASSIAHSVVLIVLIISVVIVPNLKQDNDTSMMRFAGDTVVTAVMIFIMLLISGIAITVLLEGIEKLFGLDFSYNMYECIWIMLLSVFCCILVLMIPRVGQTIFLSDFSKKTWGIIGKFIALPILFLYLAVLYVYIIKIILVWQLHDGMVSSLTVCAMAGLMMVEFTLHAKMYSDDSSSRLWQVMKHILPLLVLPPVVLMSIGIARRVSEYGWTVNRFYMTITNVWFYIACLMLLVSAFRKFRVINALLVSVSSIFLFVSIIPNANITSLTQYLLTREIEQMIANTQPAFPDHAITNDEYKSWLYEIDIDDAKRISEKINYLENNFGNESVSQWIALKDGEYPINISNNGYDRITIVENYKGEITFPEGYTRMRQLECHSRDCNVLEKRKDGIWIISIPTCEGKNCTTVVSIDSKVQRDYLTFHTKNGNVIVITYMYIVTHKQNVDNTYCEGYIFMK